MNEIGLHPVDEIDRSRAFEVLAAIPAENLWLANFTSENTRSSYRRSVGEFIAVMGIKEPAQLYAVSQGHVLAYRNHLRDKALSNASIAARLSALSSLFKFLSDRQLCRENPVSGVRRPKSGATGLGSGKTPAIAPESVRDMLNAPALDTLKGLRDRAILAVFFYTGGRCSEPSKLRVKDFRLDSEYWVLELTQKGEKTNTVAIHSECQAAIRRYLDKSGHGDDWESPLFRAVKKGRNFGAPLTRSQFYEIFKQYALAVGLSPQITPHSARSTFITQAYEAGLQGEDIQRTVGHASITTTEGYNRTAKRHRKSASFGVNY